MDGWLKQSTSIEVKVGPFVSSTDGVTPQTSLTITSSEVLLSKNEGDWAAKNESTSLVHESNGFYRCLLNTTDTNTLALLRYQIAESGCLPVWGSFLVVPANVYDSFFSTDFLQVDVISLANGVITDAAIAASGTTKIRSVTFGTADSGSTTTMVDAMRAESSVDHWKGCRILFPNGNLSGQCRLITGFDPATDTITFAPATTAAVTTHDYEILPASRVDLQLWQGAAPNALISNRVDTSVGEIAAGAINAAAIAAGAIDDDAVAADMDSYSAKIGLLDDDGGTADRYEVAWFKNGNWITSGITSPTIQVVKSSDGTNLFAATAMTEIGSLHLFKKTESTDRIVDGASYWAIARATIDGSTREWPQVVGRDST